MRTRECRVALFNRAAVSDSSSRKVDCPPKMLSLAVAARRCHCCCVNVKLQTHLLTCSGNASVKGMQGMLP